MDLSSRVHERLSRYGKIDFISIRQIGIEEYAIVSSEFSSYDQNVFILFISICTESAAATSYAFVETFRAVDAAALVRMSRKLNICGNYVPIAYATAKKDRSKDGGGGDNERYPNVTSSSTATIHEFNPRRLFLMRLPEAPSLDQRIREAAERYGRVEDLKLLG